MAKGTAHRNKPPEDGILNVTCWCESAVVKVASSKVFEGMTDTCGGEDCRAPST